MHEDDTVRAAAAGDRGVLTAFVRDTYDHVWRFCASLGNGHDTADLVQETYERAPRSLHRFEGRSSARSWLLTIARNVCADAVRRARRRRVVEAHWVWRDRVQADHAGSLEITLLLEALPRDRREAFVLTQIVGLTIPRGRRRVPRPDWHDPLPGSAGARRTHRRYRRSDGLTTMATSAEIYDWIESESAAFTATLAPDALERRVPGCPDWSLRDLAWHLGRVQRFWAATVLVRKDVPPDPALFGDESKPGPSDATELQEWMRGGMCELLDAIRSVPWDESAWVWWKEPRNVGAIARSSSARSRSAPLGRAVGARHARCVATRARGRRARGVSREHVSACFAAAGRACRDRYRAAVSVGRRCRARKRDRAGRRLVAVRVRAHQARRHHVRRRRRGNSRLLFAVE